jgi:uncharacterized membrane protein
MDLDPSSALEQQVGELRARVRRLEEALHRHGIALEELSAAQAAMAPAALPLEEMAECAAVSPPLTQPSDAGSVSAEMPALAHPFSFAREAARQDGRSLESRIGSQWFNRIGILAVLIGMAWFLKLAIDNHWIGPLGRVLIGLVAGAALIGWSERFLRHGYAGFSYSLKAVGSGILYLSLWAAFSLFHLMPAGVAFAAMIVVTAFNGFMAWIQDSELLALYAIVGGFSTPLLLSTGENHEIALFSYLLMLTLAVLALVIVRPWSRLFFGTFTGTVLFVTGWWFEFYTDAQSGLTGFFIGCFFLVFAVAPRLARLAKNYDIADHDAKDHDTKAQGMKDHDAPMQGMCSSAWDNLALVLLPIANAALGFIALYVIFTIHGAAWAGPWLAVAFAAFYLLLRLPVRGLPDAGSSLLSGLHLTAAVVFLTIAIPLKAQGRWLTIGWLMQGAVLLWFAVRVRSLLLRILALLCLALGLMALLLVNPSVSTTVIFNQRFGTYCVAIAVFAFVIWLSARPQNQLDSSDPAEWKKIGALATLAVNALILLALGWEIHNYWWHLRWRGEWRHMHDYRMYAQFSYSALFMALGAILLCAGFWRRSAFVRWQALLLLAVAIGKVFLVDVSELSQGYRILSFLGLGALLLTISFVYQRDWLSLRSHEGQPP